MSHIFISYVEEDGELAAQIAAALERERYATWDYQRDSLPGSDYLELTGDAIEQCQAVVLIISPHSLNKAKQVTLEVVRADECGKKFIPILRGVAHAEFQKRQPVWRQAPALPPPSRFRPKEWRPSCRDCSAVFSASGSSLARRTSLGPNLTPWVAKRWCARAAVSRTLSAACSPCAGSASSPNRFTRGHSCTDAFASRPKETTWTRRRRTRRRGGWSSSSTSPAYRRISSIPST